MGKELERLIIILAIILLSGTAFAAPTPEVLSGDNTVVVSRKNKPEKTEPKITTPKAAPQKTTVQNKAIPQCPCKKKKVAKKSTEPQYLGLKIYETKKPKPQTRKVAKTRCIDDPTSICNLRKLKPIDFKIEKPRYSKKYVTNRYINNKYKKYKLPDYPPAMPARAIPIITCY